MKKILFILLSLLFIFTGCEKEEQLDFNLNILDLGGDDDITKNEIDQWLKKNFTDPYNMEVIYKYNQFELSLNRTLTPIYEKNVIPVMSLIKEGWMEPFEKVAGASFIKRLSPKRFVLVGSPKYNPGTGTLTQGEAEGGRKIVIFRLNWYNESDSDLIKAILKTVFHEFSHTMHQTIMYPEELMYVTPSSYTTAWTNLTDNDAMKLGFISNIAAQNSDEDFVETIARIAVFGKEAFDARVAEATRIYNDPSLNAGMNYDPGDALRRKEAIIVNYLKQVWGVDLYDPSPGVKGLETLVQEAIQSVLDN